jgi:acyl-CoA synthetase (AMP-forming)/AMP-acid ligase II
LRPGAFPTLRLSWFTGEPLSKELATAWANAAPYGNVYNCYGPTETAIWTSVHKHDTECRIDEPILPIGLPFPSVQWALLTVKGLSWRDGDVGELLIGGPQVFEGYWSNEDATRDAFMLADEGAGIARRWYRTGDIVERRSKVGFYFRNRRDRQLKIRGNRVELKEVEHQLGEITETLVAVVPLLQGDGRCEEIVAFCLGASEDVHSIKARCASKLPAYMMPSRIIFLDEFPTTDSGKVDYASLLRTLEV